MPRGAETGGLLLAFLARFCGVIEFFDEDIGIDSVHFCAAFKGFSRSAAACGA